MSIQLKGTDKQTTNPDLIDQQNQEYKWSLKKLRQFLTSRHGVEPIEILFQRIAGSISFALYIYIQEVQKLPVPFHHFSGMEVSELFNGQTQRFHVPKLHNFSIQL